MITLNRKQFRKWLEENSGIVVGVSAERTKCPFCKFLKSKGAKKVNVTFQSRRVDGVSHVHSRWQSEFQHEAIRFEETHAITGIRGKEALIVYDNLFA